MVEKPLVERFPTLQDSIYNQCIISVEFPPRVSQLDKLHPSNEHTPPFTVLIIIVANVVQDTHKIIIFDV